jgi:hypothetical protein
MIGGQFFVHYAAFAATRAALVQIPRDLPGEPANVYVHAGGGEKFQAIRRAAVLAVVPAGGTVDLSDASINHGAVTGGFRSMFAAYEREAPNWVDAILPQRLAYADRHTDIEVFLTETDPQDRTVDFNRIGTGETVQFGPRDPITVAVLHRQHLSIPWANRLFADAPHDVGRGYYRIVSAQYTLTNQGIEQTMPPQPLLPRSD